MEASTWMGDHQGRSPAPLIRPSNDDSMECYQMNNNDNFNFKQRSFVFVDVCLPLILTFSILVAKQLFELKNVAKL
jgi:hypothetical protein